MLAALRRVGAVAGAVGLGTALALAAQPALLTQLAGRLVEAAP
ncbi:MULTISPECIES: hypothetical protein [Cellulomonas]|nr:MULTISPECIES: hypothetical protein [Cellulomonas]